MNKITIILTLILTACGLASCDTMKGVGKDLQSGGKNLEKAAEKNKNS